MMPRTKKKAFRLPRGGSLKAAGLGTIRIGPKSIVRVSSASAKGKKTSGGKRMPRPRPKRPAAKKKKRKQSYPLLGVAKGQKSGFRIGESELVVTRTPDIVRLKKMPKKQRLIRE